MTPACLQDTAEGCRLSVKAQPRAVRTEVAGPYGAELKIRVAAPPVDDAANEALQRFLAETLGVGRGHVRLVRGRTGGHKVFEVDGVSAAVAAGRLGVAG